MGGNLFIDDERLPPDDGREWFVARNMGEVIDYIQAFGIPRYISFDHDLGDMLALDDNGIPLGNGYTIAKYLVYLDMYSKEYKFPSDFSFYVHSQNPIGAENIRCYLNNYLNVKGN